MYLGKIIANGSATQNPINQLFIQINGNPETNPTLISVITKDIQNDIIKAIKNPESTFLESIINSEMVIHQDKIVYFKKERN